MHAAGLFDLGGELLVLREDVGRHNAVDKVIGWALQNDRVPLTNSLLMVSGRGGFEIVQKALVAGVVVLAWSSALGAFGRESRRRSRHDPHRIPARAPLRDLLRSGQDRTRPAAPGRKSFPRLHWRLARAFHSPGGRPDPPSAALRSIHKLHLKRNEPVTPSGTIGANSLSSQSTILGSLSFSAAMADRVLLRVSR